MVLMIIKNGLHYVLINVNVNKTILFSTI
uniref:Uncharacterized protein n=1 Tax=Anguilla anguilla TaxID=7936 RepID=A0A0E9RZK8_ANGAN